MGSGEAIALGRYVLLRKLRMQGAVEVHLGLQRSVAGVERLVIIKRLGRDLAQDPRLVEELLEEARIAGQLAHVNIAQVFDVAEDEGSYYFAMEHVHGKSLRTVLGALEELGAVLPVEHAIHIAIQLCSALSHAHEHKDPHDNRLDVIHGAISLDNVFVTFAGDVKIAEFGVLASKKWVTDTIPIAYPAPEQAREEPPDPRTDLYALGMLLLELTTGKTPLYRPPEFTPGYPPKLAAILLQAAARRRTHRHQSANELLAQFEMLAGKGGFRTSPAALARLLAELFPDADAELVRERREAKLIGAPREEARTIPDTGASSATPANVMLQVLPPDGAVDIESELRSAGLRPLTSTPPAVRTSRPRAESNRFAVLGGAVAIGVVIGLVADSLNRDPSSSMRFSSPTPSPPLAASLPAAPLAADPRQQGSLDVQSDPAGANVFVEGELMADLTPTTLQGLPLGRPLRVRVGRAGFETFQADITLSAERPRERLIARLVPSTLTLQLVFDAPDTALWVDGKYTTARTIVGLAVDEDHRIAVSAPGRIGKIVMFRSEQGGEKRLEMKLDPVRSSR